MKISPSITRDSAALFPTPVGGTSGIYCLINMVNMKCYVGSSLDIKERVRHHFSYLLGVGHHSQILQRAFNKYGIESFQWGVLEYVDGPELIAREQYWIDKVGDYNICKFAGSPRGVKMKLSDAEIERRRKAAGVMRKTLTPEQKIEYQAIATNSRRGVVTPQAVRDMLSAATKGRKLHPDHAAKLSAINKARVVSVEKREETGKTIKAALQSRTEEEVLEWKSKLSASKMGKPSPKRGVPMSDESKQKMKDAWARRKTQNKTPA
jgi:group I intron endonuclease